MRNMGILVVIAIAIAAPASAQSKLSGSLHCAKGDPDSMIEVGDKPGHMLTARKSACTWSGGEVGGSAVKTGEDVATGEITGSSAHDTGYHTATTESGDKFTVHFIGTAMMAKDNSGTIAGKWTFVSGTGKLKGIKGSGTYKGKANTDGSADVTVEGDYTLAAAAAPVKKQGR